MGNDLENKVIVLTGGASGIGRECALAYARENATVAILDSNFDAAQDTARELGGKSMALHADVSDGPAVQAAVSTVIEELGRIDAVHNNAGIVGPSRPLHETTEDEFDKVQQVNVKSVYWRSEEHTSELQSQSNLVCRLLLEKKNNKIFTTSYSNIRNTMRINN